MSHESDVVYLQLTRAEAELLIDLLNHPFRLGTEDRRRALLTIESRLHGVLASDEAECDAFMGEPQPVKREARCTNASGPPETTVKRQEMPRAKGARVL